MHKRKLLELLEKVTEQTPLNLETIDPATELLDLGITSIKFIELIVEIENEFDIEIRDSDLIIDHFKTIETLFSTIEGYLLEKNKKSMKKCVVLDCDDVLWKGVAGEETITFDDNVVSFHRILVDAYKKGYLLCLCTRNDIANIKTALSSAHSLLSIEHIVAYRANAQDKAADISAMAAELNLSLDSFVFLDNSKYELEYVRNVLPEVHSILVDYNNLSFITSLNFIIDSTVISDLDRTKMYKEQKERENAKHRYSSVDEYNASLCTNYTCGIASVDDIPRLAELSQRTNQFNLSDKHYSEEELLEISKDYQYKIIYLSASDKYGELGIIGLSVINLSSKTIEAFSMSCRAFGRGFEDVLLKKTIELCGSNLRGIYVDNQKNRKFMNFYMNNNITQV